MGLSRARPHDLRLRNAGLSRARPRGIGLHCLAWDSMTANDAGLSRVRLRNVGLHVASLRRAGALRRCRRSWRLYLDQSHRALELAFVLWRRRGSGRARVRDIGASRHRQGIYTRAEIAEACIVAVAPASHGRNGRGGDADGSIRVVRIAQTNRSITGCLNSTTYDGAIFTANGDGGSTGSSIPNHRPRSVTTAQTHRTMTTGLSMTVVLARSRRTLVRAVQIGS